LGEGIWEMERHTHTHREREREHSLMEKKKESVGKERDREEEQRGGGWENALAGCNRLQAVSWTSVGEQLGGLGVTRGRRRSNRCLGNGS